MQWAIPTAPCTKDVYKRQAFGSVDSGAPEIGIGSAIAVVIYLMTFGISLCSILFTKSKEVEL